MNQTWFDVLVTCGDVVKKTGLWAKDIEDAREKAYWKWRNADKREIIDSNVINTRP